MFLVTDNGKGPLQDEEVTRLFKMYGASPRELVLDGHRPNHHHEFIIAQVRQMDLAAVKSAFASPDKYSSHYITRIEPSYDKRKIPCKTVASRFAFELLWDEHMKGQASEMEYFPEINSLFLIKPPNERSPILLMFQMTQDKDRHDVKPKDLLAVEGLDLPLNTRKWLVVVTPFNIEPKIVVPKTDFPDRWVDTNIDEVFHFPFPLPCSDANDVLAHTAAGAHTRNTTKGFPSILHRTLHVSNCTVYCREWVKNDTCTTGVT